MKKIKENWRNHLSTLLGVLVSIANAWYSIDWLSFDISKEYPKLILSAFMVAGGYFTNINEGKSKP